MKKSAKIVHGNALRLDCEGIVPKKELCYILGNQPFVGRQWRNKEQMEDRDTVFGKSSTTGRLDYVTAWYYKAVKADLYDPLTMPPKLVRAHQALDKAVDLCYRTQPFATETARMEFLFDLHRQYMGQNGDSP